MSWMLQLRNQNPNIFWMIWFLCSSFQPVNRVVDDFPSWRSSAHGEIASTLRSFRAPTALWNVVAHPMRCDGVHPWWMRWGMECIKCVCVCFSLNYYILSGNYQLYTNMIKYVMLIWLYFPQYVFTTVFVMCTFGHLSHHALSSHV